MSGEAYVLSQTGTPPSAQTPSKAIEKGSLVAVSRAINTDWFASNITPTNKPCIHKIEILLATSAVVKILMDDPPTTDLSMSLNGGVALTANCLYVFDILVLDGQSYNLQHDTGTQNIFCSIVEHLDFGW